MNRTRLIVYALACGLVALPSFASARSALTTSFIANVKPNVDFLNTSSRMALRRSHDRHVLGYAKTMVTKQTIIGNSLVAWWQTNTLAGADAALGIRPEQSARAAFDPFGLLTPQPAPLATGRSVAEADPPTELDGTPVLAARRPSIPERFLPSQQADLDTLGRLQGPRFDAFYKSAQRNALRQLAALYRDYAAMGEDPALRSISALQLPKVNEEIVDLNGL